MATDIDVVVKSVKTGKEVYGILHKTKRGTFFIQKDPLDTLNEV